MVRTPHLSGGSAPEHPEGNQANGRATKNKLLIRGPSPGLSPVPNCVSTAIQTPVAHLAPLASILATCLRGTFKQAPNSRLHRKILLARPGS